MNTFICSVCHEPIRQAHDRLERRVQFRRLRDRSSYAVVKTADVCKACADKEIEQLRPAAVPSGEQGSML